jgi:hypothetical protein
VISKDFFADQRKITTPSGTISYVERGRGPVALLVHGVLLNGYVWRRQLAHLADLRTNCCRHGSFKKRTFWGNKSAPATPKKELFNG